MNTQDERKAFEATQNTKVLFERIDYIESMDAYMPKHEFVNNLIVMQSAERFNFGWSMWKAATERAEEKLEGCVVVPKDQIETWWQDAEEPENFETEAQNIHSIADDIDDGDIIEFHEHHTIHLPSSTLFGVWTYKEGKRVFITGTKAEVVEAARGGNE